MGRKLARAGQVIEAKLREAFDPVAAGSGNSQAVKENEQNGLKPEEVKHLEEVELPEVRTVYRQRICYDNRQGSRRQIQLIHGCQSNAGGNQR
jgi:hypothetical protein